MKVNSVYTNYFNNHAVALPQQINKNRQNKQLTNENNAISPIKQDSLTHLAFLGIQNLKYTTNVTFKGNLEKDKGYVQVYTGDGKGKTTATMGLALRALGQGKTVSITMFTKGGDDYGEIKAFNKLQPDVRKNLRIEQAGLDRIIFASNKNDEDKKIMQAGWENAKKIINSGKTDVVILDELNIALDLKLIDEEDVLKTIKNKPENVEIVLSGRNAHKNIIDAADLVSNIQLVKHYWDKGITARRGIEY
ncbi:MAG: cob(I)yrinic acid a,c-diamide adenosyltransferase [Candidatus Gastranaerophilaceae bacterium]